MVLLCEHANRCVSSCYGFDAHECWVEDHAAIDVCLGRHTLTCARKHCLRWAVFVESTRVLPTIRRGEVSANNRFFMLGAFCFSTFHRKFGPTHKGTLVSSFLFQTIVILTVAILVTTKVVSNHVSNWTADTPEAGVWILTMARGINWNDLAPISLLSFQAAGQIVTSRVLRHNDLLTIVITSMLCDMMSNTHLLTGGVLEDSKGNRRAVSAVLLFLGAIVGGVLTRSWVGLAGALFIAAALKALMVFAWLF